MLYSQILRRSSIGLAWLLIAAIGGLATMLYGYIGALLFGLVVTVTLILVVMQVPSSPERVAVHRPAAHTARRTITTDDGDSRHATVIPVSTDEQYQMVLTRDGYVMVNDDGRVVYSLKS